MQGWIGQGRRLVRDWANLKRLRARHYLPARAAAERHGRDLQPVQDHTGSIRPGDILCVVVLRNEAVRLPFFLKHYRGMGVRHFLFIDNGSTDGLMDRLGGAEDCSVWRTEASYRDSNFGVHWQNFLLNRHCQGHWCLVVDPDEILIYPYWQTRGLRELTRHLEEEGRESLFCLMLDMYPEGPVTNAIYHEGQDPIDLAPWFDADGYVQRPNRELRHVWIQGGVRRRMFFRDRPQDAPALNKTALVKWGNEFAYLSSTHTLWPRRANLPHPKGRTVPTGVLLHYKYLHLFREKVVEEVVRGEHYAGSREYQRYNELLWRDALVLHAPGVSARLHDWRVLVDRGLMHVGTWF